MATIAKERRHERRVYETTEFGHLELRIVILQLERKLLWNTSVAKQRK
jgi:hypothetical protein